MHDMAIPNPDDRNALASQSARDLLGTEPSKTYFELTERKAYFDSLKTVDGRRSFHPILIETCTRFLDLTRGEGEQAIVDALMASGNLIESSGAGQVAIISNILRSQSRGCKLLNIAPPVSLDKLKKCYKQAALANHPDRGGSHEDMIAINEAYSSLHAAILNHPSGPGIDPELGAAPSLSPAYRIAKCIDYRYSTARLLLAVYLDEWALDHAFEYLQLLVGGSLGSSPYID